MMYVRIFDVEHGACAMVQGPTKAIAMIDCGHNCATGWRPSTYITSQLNRRHVEYFLVTNADQDHISDLSTLVDSGISLQTLISNVSVSPQALRLIKERCGPLTADAKALLKMRENFGAPEKSNFSEVMDNIGLAQFGHTYPVFTDTNNLSAVYFLKYGAFQMLFPGDLERDGWLAFLQNQAFLAELRKTTILVASHHGRENGFCEQVFSYLKPQAVVISDKSIVHSTQEFVPNYRNVVIPQDGIIVIGESKRRHVLTTRRDGDILFAVNPDDGGFRVYTAAAGSCC